MDGVPGIGAGNIEPGQLHTYEFDATPFGLHLYHCHSTPLAEHIAKGLYGAFVIDPEDGRADGRRARDGHERLRHQLRPCERGLRGQHRRLRLLHEPIRVKRGELVRIYLVNALEFDLINSFHIHANFFDYYPTGTRLEPRDFTDTVIQGQGERGILELRFPYAGKYMFHAHVCEFADLAGWASSRWTTDGGRHRDGCAAPRGSPGCCRVADPGRRRSALFVALDAPGLDRVGVPQEELAVERTVLRPGEIELHLRNDGADPVRVEQAIVNDGFAAFSQTSEEIGRLARLRRDGRSTPGSRARPTRSSLLTATGATIDHAIDAAAEIARRGPRLLRADGADRPLRGRHPGRDRDALAALGAPIDARWMRFLLAFTVGLLAFLGIDALLEGIELAGEGAAGARRRGRSSGSARRSPTWRWRASTAGCASAGSARARAPDRASARRSWSRSGSASTTSARASRSAPRTRSARSRSAPRSWSASRCTTPPRAWRSWRPSRGCRQGAVAHARPARAARRGPGHPRRLDRRVGLQPERGRAHVRHRRGRHRPGDRADRAEIRDGDGARCSARTWPAVSLLGLFVMYATGLLVSV